METRREAASHPSQILEITSIRQERLAPVTHRPGVTISHEEAKPKDPLPRQETSGVTHWIWYNCKQSNYLGETEKMLRTRTAKRTAAVRTNDVSSRVLASSTEPSHTSEFDKAEIVARVGNCVNLELLESRLSIPQSSNRRSDLPHLYSVLGLGLSGIINQAGIVQARSVSSTSVGELNDGVIIMPKSDRRDDKMVAINDLDVGHQAVVVPRTAICDEGVSD
nr:unnamed protein product [Spirometra erinaceieuropaei]